MERDIAVMLVDFRRGRSPRRLLPHDLLYALDRLGETVGDTTRAAGGLPNYLMGDSVMVLFGLDGGPVEANRQALLAAADLDLRLAALHLQLQRELGCATGHVIHLHAGMAVVGETDDRLTRTQIAARTAIDVVRQLAAIDQRCTPRFEAGQAAGRIVVSRPVWIAAQRDRQALVAKSAQARTFRISA